MSTNNLQRLIALMYYKSLLEFSRLNKLILLALLLFANTSRQSSTFNLHMVELFFTRSLIIEDCKTQGALCRVVTHSGNFQVEENLRETPRTLIFF